MNQNKIHCGRTPYVPTSQQGYTLAAALVLIAILSIFMALSLPVWEHVKQRENEEELIFRGKEYMEAIGRYHAKFNSYPPDLDTLLKQHFIRRLYKDPMTESGAWKVLRPDSLVETGEAGAINQPGQQPRQGENQEEETEPGQIPQQPQMGSEESEHAEGQDLTAEDQETEEPEAEVIGPIAGVVSRSKKSSIRLYNGQNSYNKWVFTYTVPQESQQQQQQDQQGGKGKKPKKVEKPGSDKQTGDQNSDQEEN